MNNNIIEDIETDSFSEMTLSSSAAPIPPPLPPRLVRQPPIRRTGPVSHRSNIYSNRVAASQTTAKTVSLSAVESLARGFVYFDQKIMTDKSSIRQ